MKNKIIITILMLVIVMLIWRFYDNSKSVNLKEEHVSNLHLFQVVDESFTSTYGKPIEEKNILENRMLNFKDRISIIVNNSGQIVSVSVNGNNNLGTKKGVNVGDEVNNVIKIYGYNYYKRTEQGAEIIYYIDHKNDRKIEFWCRDDTVVMIKLKIKELG